MYARFLAYLRLIDWCALSTSALILSACLWLTSPFVPQNNNQYESTQKEPDKKTAAITAQSVEDQIADYTLLLAIFTGILAISTIGLWIATRKITRDSADGRQRIERAFIKVSHAKKFEEIGSDSVRFSFEVKNFGRTPARIRDVIIEMHTGGEPTPIPPKISDQLREKVAGFLVSGDYFFHTAIYKMNPTEIEAMRQGKLTAWLFGVVDYDDVFGQRHQVGYGRIFNKIAGDFVFIANDRYNYDRPRVVGKGNDWNQAT